MILETWLQTKQNLVVLEYFSIIHLRAAYASLVIASASSSIINLKGYVSEFYNEGILSANYLI